MFVECDPSDTIFQGFRRSEGFYEKFARRLLEQVLEEVPTIQVVEFDGWRAVKKSGDMLVGLLKAVTMHEKLLAWGPESGWGKEDGRESLFDPLVIRAGSAEVVSRSVAIFA